MKGRAVAGSYLRPRSTPPPRSWPRRWRQCWGPRGGPRCPVAAAGPRAPPGWARGPRPPPHPPRTCSQNSVGPRVSLHYRWQSIEICRRADVPCGTGFGRHSLCSSLFRPAFLAVRHCHEPRTLPTGLQGRLFEGRSQQRQPRMLQDGACFAFSLQTILTVSGCTTRNP
jgi:hypothetical protein